MGLFAFRLSLAELLKKTSLPMIFDDSLAVSEPEFVKAILAVLQNTCSQFFISTSSREILDLCRDSAAVCTLQ
jgi:uncharacterized protein YhaN